MLGQLLKILRPKRRKNRPHRDWEFIGGKNYGAEDLTKVPPWVRKSIAHIYSHKGGSSLGEMTYYLKGKTYRYRLSFSGQGGPILDVYRRRRAK